MPDDDFGADDAGASTATHHNVCIAIDRIVLGINAAVRCVEGEVNIFGG